MANNESNKIKNLKNSIYSGSENKVIPPEPKKQQDVEMIHITEPQPFNIVEATTYIRSSEMAHLINEVLSAIFVDYKECNISYNPLNSDPRANIPSVRCVARFQYMVPEEIKNVDPDGDKIVAVNTTVEEATSNYADSTDYVAEIKKFQAAINAKGITTLTKQAKKYLKDIVIKRGKGSDGFDWNLSTYPHNDTVMDYPGHTINVITIDIDLDIISLIRKIYNGTSQCPDFKHNKRYGYRVFYSNSISGNEFLMGLTRYDTNAQKKVSESIGYHTSAPTTWNNPVQL